MSPRLFLLRLFGLVLFLLIFVVPIAAFIGVVFAMLKLGSLGPGGELAMTTAMWLFSTAAVWRSGRAERPTPAEAQMARSLFVWGLAYVAIAFVVHTSLEARALPVWVTVSAALLPAVPIGGVILAAWRYLASEADELLRLIMTRAIVVASGLTMFLLTIWGYSEAYIHAPHFPLGMTFPIFLMFFSGTSFWIRRRYA